MNIYLLDRSHVYKIGYDETVSVVVVAESEAAARKLAKTATGDQDKVEWCYCPCVLLGDSYLGVVSGIIHASFRAG